jgi:hypothetical protein
MGNRDVQADSMNRKSYAEDMPFMKILNDAMVLPLFDGGNVGVRRRQLQKIMEGEGYEAWEATVR